MALAVAFLSSLLTPPLTFSRQRLLSAECFGTKFWDQRSTCRNAGQEVQEWDVEMWMVAKWRHGVTTGRELNFWDREGGWD